MLLLNTREHEKVGSNYCQVLMVQVMFTATNPLVSALIVIRSHNLVSCFLAKHTDQVCQQWVEQGKLAERWALRTRKSLCTGVICSWELGDLKDCKIKNKGIPQPAATNKCSVSFPNNAHWYFWKCSFSLLHSCFFFSIEEEQFC